MFTGVIQNLLNNKIDRFEEKQQFFSFSIFNAQTLETMQLLK